VFCARHPVIEARIVEQPRIDDAAQRFERLLGENYRHDEAVLCSHGFERLDACIGFDLRHLQIAGDQRHGRFDERRIDVVAAPRSEAFDQRRLHGAERECAGEHIGHLDRRRSAARWRLPGTA
jgi:hypothetical protein